MWFAYDGGVRGPIVSLLTICPGLVSDELFGRWEALAAFPVAHEEQVILAVGGMVRLHSAGKIPEFAMAIIFLKWRMVDRKVPYI